MVKNNFPENPPKEGLFGKRKRNEITPVVSECTLPTGTPTGRPHAKSPDSKMAFLFISIPPPEVTTMFSRKSGLES